MNIKDIKKRQNENYKFGTTKSRCVKILINDAKRQNFAFILSEQRKISKLVFSNRQKIDFLDEKVADHLFPSYVISLEKEGYTKSFIKRQIIRPVIRRYKSYLKRNKRLPNYSISIKDKNIEIYNSCVSIDVEKQQICFNYHHKKLGIPPQIYSFSSVGTMAKNEKYLQKDNGGQMIFGKNTYYTARVEIPVSWDYSPEGFIGFDLNKTSDSFMVFSHNINFFGEITNTISKKHPLLKKALRLENVLKELNEISRKKSKDRRKIQRKHKSQKKEYIMLVEELIKYCRANKLCVCVDNLSCGSRTGSFGHDKVIELLIKECENSGTPFILVPTPYTTKICHKCQHMTKRQIKLSEREFDCESCGVRLIRDHNSAMNIAHKGQLIWENGFDFVEKMHKTKYNKSMIK